jgi:hypothetical protein
MWCEKLDNKNTKISIIVGTGFCGLMIATEQARLYSRLYASNQNLPPLEIILIDKQEKMGGVAYSTTDEAFMLNQPASEMSPFSDDPEHFTRWLGGDKSEFATRKQYGEYLRQTLKEAFETAAGQGVPLDCKIIHDEVETVDFSQEDCAVLHAKEFGSMETEALVLATGHTVSPFLQKFEKEPRYFSTPYSLADVAKTLESDPYKQVMIVGTGQSMLDALATLDALKYEGMIYAVSRHLVEPWAFHTEKHEGDVHPYIAKFLSPEVVQEKKLFSGAALIGALEQEIQHAQSKGYDVDQALVSIDFSALSQSGENATAPEGLEELRAVWKAYYGNPTPPARYALFTDYKSRGQLKLIKGALTETDVIPVQEGFKLNARAMENGEALSVSALFNGASFSRDPIATPLLQQAKSQNALRFSFNDATVVATGDQKHSSLFVAGYAVSPDKWGVGSFRKNNAVIARRSLEKILATKINV